ARVRRRAGACGSWSYLRAWADPPGHWLHTIAHDPGSGCQAATGFRVLRVQSRLLASHPSAREDRDMAANSLLDTLRAACVVPVVRTRQARHAATAVQWLRDAGLRVFEITMTIPDAPALIRELAGDPALLVGAGTVADRTTAEACLAAGAA